MVLTERAEFRGRDAETLQAIGLAARGKPGAWEPEVAILKVVVVSHFE
jgi:hypothetical protein